MLFSCTLTMLKVQKNKNKNLETKKTETPTTSGTQEIHTCKQNTYIHTQICGWYEVLASFFFPLYLKTQVWFPVYQLLILNKQGTSVKTE